MVLVFIGFEGRFLRTVGEIRVLGNAVFGRFSLHYNSFGAKRNGGK